MQTDKSTNTQVRLTPARLAILHGLADGRRLAVYADQSGWLCSEDDEGRPVRAATLRPLLDAGLVVVDLPGECASLTDAGLQRIRRG